MFRSKYCAVFVLVLLPVFTAIAQLELFTPLAPNVSRLTISADGQRAFCISSFHRFRQENRGEWIPADDALALPANEPALDIIPINENLDTFYVPTQFYTFSSRELYWTTDGGDSFEPTHFLREGNPYRPQHFAFSSENHNRIYAAEQYWLHRSVNGGQSWSSLSTGCHHPFGIYLDPLVDETIWIYGVFQDLEFPDSNDYGLVKSSNDGVTWQPVIDLAEITGENMAFCDGVARISNGSVFAFCYTNYVSWFIRSDDDGENWTRITDLSGNSILGTPVLALLESNVAPGTLLVGGEFRGVFRSADFGATWAESNSGLPSGDFNVISFAQLHDGSGTIVANLSDYGLYESTDLGASWHPYASPSVGSYGRVDESGGAIFSTMGARVHVLVPPYASWQEVSIPQFEDSNVYCRNPYYAGDGSIMMTFSLWQEGFGVFMSGICRTTDLGENWTLGPSVAAIMSDALWIPSDTGLVFVSTSSLSDTLWFSADTGATWLRRVLPEAEHMCTLSASGTTLFSASHDGRHVWRSDNFGETWTRLHDAPLAGAAEVYANGSETYLSVGKQSGDVDSLFVFNYHHGNWQLVLSDSAGYESDPFRSSYGSYPIVFLQDSIPTTVVRAGGNKLRFKRDDESEWRTLNMELSNGIGPLTMFTGIEMVATDRLWLTSDVGPCFLYFDELGLGIDDQAPITPTDFSLAAFPNPFNNSVQLSFALPHAGETSLTIYDVLGRRVADILHEPLTSGHHNTVWSANDIASGSYFARLTQGQHSHVTKLHLIK